MANQVTGVNFMANGVEKFVQGFKDVEEALSSFKNAKAGIDTKLDFPVDNIADSFTTIQSYADKLSKAFDEVKADPVKNLIDLFTALEDQFSGLDGATGQWMSVLMGTVVTMGSSLAAANGMVESFEGVQEIFGQLQKINLESLTGLFPKLSPQIMLVIGIIVALISILTHLYNTNETVRAFIDNAWNSIKNTIGTVVEAISVFVRDIFGRLTEWWQENNQLIKDTVEVIWNRIKTVIKTALDIIVPIVKTAWEGIKNNAQAIWNVIKSVITTALDLIGGIIRTVMQIITGDWSGAWNTIKSTISTLISNIRDIISDALIAVATIVQSRLNTIKAAFSSIFNKLRGIVSETFNKVKTAVTEGMEKALGTITGFFGSFEDAGFNIMSMIAKGLKNTLGLGKITDAISGAVKIVRDFLPASPAKVGPLTDIHRLNFGGTIADSIYRGQGKIERAMNQALAIPDIHADSSITSRLQHEISNKQPAYIHLTLGGHSFKAFVEDISKVQSENIRFETEFGL